MTTTLFVVLVGLFCFLGVEAKRPKLVNSSVWFTPHATILNNQYDSMLVQMDFDQPLYTNGFTFLCPLSEYSCPELTCKACDWSGQQPAGCDDTDCCGPAELGKMELAQSWCSTDGPEYKTLKIGETSERFTLAEGESMYVRFFVPEEYYCRPINIIPRPYYGAPSASFSSWEAYPTFSTDTGWRDSLNSPAFGFGQNAILICPNRTLHAEYNVGTFAGIIYGLVPTSFEVEILVSPQTHPLPEPENRLSCDDVPDDVMEYANTDFPAYCIEDGQTLTVDPSNLSGDTLEVVLPVPKGCHTLSFVSAMERPTSAIQSHYMICLPTQTDKKITFDNGVYYRSATEGEGMVLTACFEEEVTYLFCLIRVLYPTLLHFQFSTVAPVVRKNLIDIPDASLAMQDGLQHAWAVNFGKPKFGCFNFFTACYDWLATPSDNTLYLFPPPVSPEENDAFVQIVFEDIQEVYREEGLQTKKANRLSLTAIFSSDTISAVTKNLTSLSIAISAITNEDGEPVELPGGGVDQNPDDQKQYSMSNFVSHIPLSQIPEFEFPSCDFEKYQIYHNIVRERLEKVGTEKNLLQILSLKYSIDSLNQGVLAESCTSGVVDNLGTFVANKERITTSCPYGFEDEEYYLTPCCNAFLTIVSTCLPFTENETKTFYEDIADVSGCGEPDCAQSYYQELSFSLNHLEDVSLGCTSGVTAAVNTFSLELAEVMDKQYLHCLESVGFGDQYQGVDCQIDADCENLLGECYLGKCTLPALETVEDQFLSCYIASMPSSFEFYLKRNILPDSVSNADVNSTEFYLALKEAATIQDCVNPLNPLDIKLRTQYHVEPVDYACVARRLGLTWPADAEEVLELCPGTSTLRSFPLAINLTACESLCLNIEVAFRRATEEDCRISEECNIDYLDDCDGSYCVYCPPGDKPCLEVPNYTNEEDCTNSFACELADGTVDFTLTEEECRGQGVGCSADCAGESCESIHNLVGGCFVSNISSSFGCSAYGVANNETVEWYNDELCALPEIVSLSSCQMLPSTQWSTCQQNELGECDGRTAQQQFLGCYVSLWHSCPNQEECKKSGRCTDRDYYVIVRSDEDPVKVQNGACLTAGEFTAKERPSCRSTNFYETMITGCLAFTVNNSVDCAREGEESAAFFVAPQWMSPSLTKDECLANEIGKTGCRMIKDPQVWLFWILDNEECTFRGGRMEEAWEWIPGVWQGGVPRSLVWKEAEKRNFHQFQSALSFILLADWIQASTEEQFLYPLKSQTICESESINNPVNTLVCDCLAGEGEVCYDAGEEQKEIPMGLSEICQGETAFVKNPSAQVNFDQFSVFDGCSFLNISLISRNWFTVPYAAPPLSFKWQDQRERGVVINQNEATVGEVLGDGLVLSFSDPSMVGEFDVCLRLNTEESGKYNILDFGYSISSLEAIQPLGLPSVNLGDLPAGVWYCSPFDFQTSQAIDGDTIYLFPITRLENYEDEEDNYTDDTTKGLCYTLGVLYCLLGLSNFLAMMAFVTRSIKTRKQRVSLPNFCTTTFLILCVFRACFMFLYPSGTFEDEPLTYLIVFEIPTFLLFSTVIFVIYIFKRLVFKDGFYSGNPVKILVFGWSFVWLLFAVIVIIFSEVILEDEAKSACEGRVEANNDQLEEDTRTLAIAYQSVIIAITLILTIIFFRYAYLIYTRTENKSDAFAQFVIVVAGSFNVAFVMRSVLFIFILALDFSSSVYLFCTLFFTEVLMMVFLFAQFHQHYFQSMKAALTSSTSAPSSSQS